MKNVIKRYSNGEITVVWEPAKCIHSKKCFHGLPKVFDPNQRPWVNIEGSNTQTISDQVTACPSGALSLEGEAIDEKNSSEGLSVRVLPNGPLIFENSAIITGTDNQQAQKKGPIAFCRCGASNNKPYCDGSHVKVEFKDG